MTHFDYIITIILAFSFLQLIKYYLVIDLAWKSLHEMRLDHCP